MMSGRGFSLIEIAVVLVIIAILVTAVGIPLATQLDQQRTIETQKQLEAIKESIYGFALANGRLPCPATDGVLAGTVNSRGVESFSTGAPLGTPANGLCMSYTGFVPAATLGISPVDAEGFALDGWGLPQNRIRYAVARGTVAAISAACPTAPGTNVIILTATDALKTITMGCASVTTPGLQPMLRVCGNTPASTTACTGTPLTSSAPFVLISLGKNAGSTASGTGADEAYNIATGTRFVFVSRIPTTQGVVNEFDDIVTWGSLNTLFARMVQAGKLP